MNYHKQQCSSYRLS